MSADIEKRAYSRGYAAGRKRVRVDRSNDQKYREQQAFLDKAFLAALPALIAGGAWKTGETLHDSVDGRVLMAWRFAKQALKQRAYP